MPTEGVVLRCGGSIWRPARPLAQTSALDIRASIRRTPHMHRTRLQTGRSRFTELPDGVCGIILAQLPVRVLTRLAITSEEWAERVAQHAAKGSLWAYTETLMDAADSLWYGMQRDATERDDSITNMVEAFHAAGAPSTLIDEVQKLGGERRGFGFRGSSLLSKYSGHTVHDVARRMVDADVRQLMIAVCLRAKPEEVIRRLLAITEAGSTTCWHPSRLGDFRGKYGSGWTGRLSIWTNTICASVSSNLRHRSSWTLSQLEGLVTSLPEPEKEPWVKQATHDKKHAQLMTETFTRLLGSTKYDDERLRTAIRSASLGEAAVVAALLFLSARDPAHDVDSDADDDDFDDDFEEYDSGEYHKKYGQRLGAATLAAGVAVAPTSVVLELLQYMAREDRQRHTQIESNDKACADAGNEFHATDYVLYPGALAFLSTWAGGIDIAEMSPSERTALLRGIGQLPSKLRKVLVPVPVGWIAELVRPLRASAEAAHIAEGVEQLCHALIGSKSQQPTDNYGMYYSDDD